MVSLGQQTNGNLDRGGWDSVFVKMDAFFDGVLTYNLEKEYATPPAKKTNKEKLSLSSFSCS